MESIKNRFNLNGKVAVITGSSKGIGESIARGLAEFGAKVIVSSRSKESVDKVANSMLKDGLDAHAIDCHVGNEIQRNVLIEKVINDFGRIDILVNNAGTNPYYGRLQDMSIEVYQKTMDINLNAAMALSNLVYPYMKAQGGGSIIHISSIEGIHPTAMMGAYNISKAGLIMLGQNQAVEWARDNIRVNIICPGLVRTKLSASLFANEQIEQKVLSKIPMKRAASPEEMSGMACFLASDASSYCTGSVLVNDGGLLHAPLF